jgi:hypothetical protein
MQFLVQKDFVHINESGKSPKLNKVNLNPTQLKMDGLSLISAVDKENGIEKSGLNPI